jgi:aminopeptidase N
MRESQAKTIHLKDYTPPPFLIGRVSLDIDIRADDAIVKATLAVKRNGSSDAPLVLDGDELELVSLLLDGKEFPHEVKSETLTLQDVPDAFTLETVTRIVPQKNTKLEGLYATQSGFVTQCEAQGFRRITWFVDRPDNLAVYTVTVRADQKKYPVLLSNGNQIASGENWAKF